MFHFTHISSARALYHGNETILSFWRERIFTYTFFSLIIICIIPYIVSCRLALSEDRLFRIGVYTLLYSLVLVSVLFKWIPFRFRLWAGVLTFYFIGLYALLSSGAGADSSRLFLLCFSILAAIFGGFKAGLITLAVNVMTLAGVGHAHSYILSGTLGVAAPASEFTAQAWVVFAGTFIMINMIMTVAIGCLLHAVETSGKEFRMLVNGTSDLIWSLSQDLKISYVSPSAYAIFGYGQKELVGCFIHDFMDPKKVIQFKSMLATGEFVYETQILHRDRSRVDVEITGARTGRRDGANGYYRGTIKNISGQKALEKERDQLKSELSRALKYKSVGVISGTMAHDLNSILSGIATYPEVLLLNETIDDPVRSGIGMIRQAGKKAADIVNDFMLIASTSQSAKYACDLNRLIEMFLQSAEYDTLIAKAFPNMALSVELEPDLLLIRASSVHVEKAMIYLLWFAFSQARSGGQGRIEIRTANRYFYKSVPETGEISPGEYTCLEIRDNGPQIETKHLDSLFEPFFIHKAMGKPGTGLELTLVRHAVEDHEGHIRVTSDDKSTFYQIFFPSIRPPLDPAGKWISEIRSAGQTVLVIDPEHTQQEIAGHILETLGYRYRVVQSPRKVVRLIREEKIDLVILDLGLFPQADHLDMLKTIKQTDPGQRLIVSGIETLTPDENQWVRSMGAVVSVKKPLTLLELGIAIKEEMDR